MEPLTFFAAAVAFIGVFHLVSTTVDAISKKNYANATHTTAKRNDWYCFFSLSSLTGENTIAADDRQDMNQSITHEEYKRRQQAQRPRLYTN